MRNYHQRCCCCSLVSADHWIKDWSLDHVALVDRLSFFTKSKLNFDLFRRLSSDQGPSCYNDSTIPWWRVSRFLWTSHLVSLSHYTEDLHFSLLTVLVSDLIRRCLNTALNVSTRMSHLQWTRIGMRRLWIGEERLNCVGQGRIWCLISQINTLMTIYKSFKRFKFSVFVMLG